MRDRVPMYDGPGYRAGDAGGIAGGAPPIAFDSSGIQLLSWLPIPEFGPEHSSGNDCWGYVSGSGREYALMGLSNGLGIVEITDPASPVIIDVVAGPASLWRDVKTYQTYAYVVNEDSGGIQVVDLSQVDSGIVTELAPVGSGDSHNVVIDEVSGFLYRTGGVGNGLIIYSLANPASPVEVGAWPDRYVHDAQVVTMTTGDYAGEEIAFCLSGLSSGWVDPGIDILNVSDKGNIELLARYLYPNAIYSHQAWLSADEQYLYLNDEKDEDDLLITSTTHIIDVSDLTAPVEATTATNGNTAITHNLYLRDGLMYAANYRSGVRIFDLSAPLAPAEVAYFDTWPEDDQSSFNGLWSVYPYFPSGIVIGSDLEKGLFVWYVGDPQLAFSYPGGLPQNLDPAGGETIQVQIDGANGAALEPGSATLHFDDGGGPQQVSLTPLGGNLFDAVFPAVTCGVEVSYYVSGQADSGLIWRDPPLAPADPYQAFAALDESTPISDDFEVDTGWAAANLGASSGDWERGVPVDDPGWEYDPIGDSDGSGSCWLTQNVAGNTDVDDGEVELVSSALDLTGGAVKIEYDYFLRMTNPAGTDRLLVEMSVNDLAGPWIEVARHETNGDLLWRTHAIDQAVLDGLGIVPSSTTRLRFNANDADPQSIVEAGLDNLRVTLADCGEGGPPSDFDGSGTVDVVDLLQLLAAWGPCTCVEDLDGSGAVDVVDLLQLLAEWS